MAQRDAHPGKQLAHAERLGDVVVRAGVERLDLRLLLMARREHHDRHRRPLADSADELAAVVVGQREVDDGEVGPVRTGVDRAALGGGRLNDAEPLGAERTPEETADLRLVLYHEDSRHAGASAGTVGCASIGSEKRKALPPIGSLSAQARPPCSTTIAREMARPRPTPPGRPSAAPCSNLAKMRSSSP